MEHQIIDLGHRMVVETTLAVKVIIERRTDVGVWPNDSEVAMCIMYVGNPDNPGPHPIQTWVTAESLFDAVLAMEITKDAPISFVCDDDGNVFLADTILDEHGNELHAPKRNVLERLDAPVKTITAEEAGFPPPWE